MYPNGQMHIRFDFEDEENFLGYSYHYYQAEEVQDQSP